MNSEEIDRIKKSYFLGNSTLEEEKWIKENSDDELFDVLQDEKQTTMNFEFDTFIEVVGSKEAKRMFIVSFRKSFYWSAAASVIVVFFGVLALMQNDSIDSTKLATKVSVEVDEDVEHVTTNPSMHQTVDNSSVTMQTVVGKTQKRNKETARTSSVEPAYDPAYVVINGKPIYDLEEAKKLTLHSLQVLASNVEKGISSMENVKYLSVKF